jgi:uncharacterized OB-fold protein
MSRPSQRRGSTFSRDFLAYLELRELRYARCRGTGEVLGYTSRQAAGDPGGEIDWLIASGRASLRSFAIYHQAYGPEPKTPYNVALVALEEGPLLVSTVRIDDLEDLRIDMPLRAAFEDDGRLVFAPRQ